LVLFIIDKFCNPRWVSGNWRRCVGGIGCDGSS